jgi:UDP-N-acetylmuramyl pentapeptide synthase
MSKATLNKIEAAAALTSALAAAIAAAKAAGLETDEIVRAFEGMTEIMGTDE